MAEGYNESALVAAIPNKLADHLADCQHVQIGDSSSMASPPSPAHRALDFAAEAPWQQRAGAALATICFWTDPNPRGQAQQGRELLTDLSVLEIAFDDRVDVVAHVEGHAALIGLQRFESRELRRHQ